MKKIFTLELLKINSGKTYLFWIVSFLIYSVAVIASKGVEKSGYYKMLALSGNDKTSILLLGLAFLLFISLISTNEFKERTIYRSLYEGFNRSDIFLCKVLIIFSLAVCIALFSRIVFGVICYIKGYSLLQIFNLAFHWHRIAEIIIFLYCFGIIALALSLLTKKGYWAITLFFVWFIFENIVMIISKELQSMLPVNMITLIFDGSTMNIYSVLYVFVFQLIMLLFVYNEYLKIQWFSKR